MSQPNHLWTFVVDDGVAVDGHTSGSVVRHVVRRRYDFVMAEKVALVG